MYEKENIETTFGYWGTNTTDELRCARRIDVGFVKERSFVSLDDPEYLLQIVINRQTHS